MTSRSFDFGYVVQTQTQAEQREREMEQLAELREAVENAELVDAHAHNLVAIDSTVPFLRGFSEADGDALSDTVHTLSFKRSLRDIAELYGCELSLQGVEEYRQSAGLQKISSLCFREARIAAVYIDDGIDLDKKHDIEWHRSFAPVVGRILRIERLAEEILDQEVLGGSTWTLNMFIGIFVGKLKSVAHEIVGLKSIAAYRSGLDINTYVTREEAEEGLIQVLDGEKPVRLTNKSFIDYIFLRSLEVAQWFDLPMQIHTGFGDRDLDLRLANPLHLCTLLKDLRFLKCRIVLLHAAYPFSREASYLASVYPQVYLDFGLAIPKLSVHGMISSVKELLQLAPIKKVMFSTDGVAFPEMFYLGAKRAREVVFSVLRDTCIDGDLSVSEAVEAARDIFALNAVQFYKINLAFRYLNLKSVSANLVKTETMAPLNDVALIRIIWVDASGQNRCRVVPRNRFNNVVKKNGVGLTFACMGMSSAVDGPADGTNLTAVGEIRLVPDLSTKWKVPWTKQEEMVLADMHLKPGEPWEYCPREALRRVSKVLKDEFNLVMNAGFETEFYLLKSLIREGKEEWVPFDFTPYCSTAGYDAASPVLREVVAALWSLKIPVEQLHPEAGNGQFEVAVGHSACHYAADNLIFTHEIIRAVARKHGLLATFVPKYSLEDIGSGSHVHISLWKDGENVFMAPNGSFRHGMSKTGEEFMAGVLYHLPSILAFTAPMPNSYDRIQPNTWSGAYQCWGKENREAPLRTTCPPGIPDGLVSNFEIKSFDGCANPLLGLASILASGIDGLRKHLTLPEPIDQNPSSLEAELQRMPRSLAESLDALQKDAVMRDLIGEKLLVAVEGVRKADIEYFSQNKDAYKQLIHRY